MLILHIVSSPNGNPKVGASFEITKDLASLGRDLGCDIVLPDPQRVVSSHHADIRRSNNIWSFTDTSTNGTHHNQATNIIAKEQTVALANGDLLGIGDFELKVEIVPELPDTPSTRNHHAVGIDLDPRVEPVLVDNGRSAGNINAADTRDGLPGIFADLIDEPSAAISTDSGSSTPQPERRSNPAMVVPPIDSVLDDPPPIDFDPFADDSHTPHGRAPVEEKYEKVEPPAHEWAYSPPAVSAHYSEAKDDHCIAVESAPEESDDALTPARDTTSTTTAHLAFTRGLGVEIAEKSNADTEAMLYSAGQLLRECVQGLITLNGVRNEVKRQFGLSTTEMQALDNNAIKFSANLNDTLARLLNQEVDGGAYLNPTESIGGAFNDILAHQIALLTGMRSAINMLMDRFDPDTLQESVSEDASVLDKVGLVKDESRYWKKFVATFAEISVDKDNDYLRVLGEGIHAAYNAQIHQNLGDDAAANHDSDSVTPERP